ncbi:hypothetical protein [Bathymodiolus thermophilus thioautotrophic gill symbiont]|uniref:Uncharacterized protein n=1 Tax=Bathymodiolus thermophilus thioautotrophic gill symbiont TaxID=2360 RepID=A0A1J5U6E0_9GAMM|nr:hypothetical protein [Bathymodiolus thermophilus thioautotrophic gill symbiont]OIR23969.1 hypothetical protein BGC33_08790 [Bathymodiolus thermophilus thioautotrophic gill symbiont]
MNKITLKDVIIVSISLFFSFVLYYQKIIISSDLASQIFVALFTLVAFFLSIASLSVNSWESNVILRLREGGHYMELISTLKKTSYLFVLTGLYAVLYSVFCKEIPLISLYYLSAILLFLVVCSTGYFILNIRRIFMILEYMEKG